MGNGDEGGGHTVSDSYRFRLGEFVCIALSDGGLNYPVAAFFANAPRTEVADLLAARGLSTSHVHTPYTCLYVDTGRNRVLIDTGAGGLYRHASQIFPDVDNSASMTGNLPANLAAAGITPDQIDTVVITHAHPDHVGGTLGPDGRPLFGQARYYIAEPEWAFWESDVAMTGPSAQMVAIARANLRPIRDRISFVADGEEIVPGITAIATPGHTPGHVALLFTSVGQRLYHISDAALYPLHLEYPDWVPAFDVEPALAVRSKRRVCDMAAQAGALVFAHHFPPFPSLGRLAKQGTGWRWLPVG